MAAFAGQAGGLDQTLSEPGGCLCNTQHNCSRRTHTISGSQAQQARRLAQTCEAVHPRHAAPSLVASAHLVVLPELSGVLVRPQAAVCGGQLALQPRGDFVQLHGKAGQVVPASTAAAWSACCTGSLMHVT